MGSGPFIFGEHVAGSHWTGKKNPNYFMPGRPYLDSFRAIFIRDTAPRVAAVRSGQAIVEFRGFNPAARDDIVKSLGNKAVVQESPWACNILVTFNNEKKAIQRSARAPRLDSGHRPQRSVEGTVADLGDEIYRRGVSAGIGVRDAAGGTRQAARFRQGYQRALAPKPSDCSRKPACRRGSRLCSKTATSKSLTKSAAFTSSTSGARSVSTSRTCRSRAGPISTICARAISTPASISIASSWTSPIFICSST